MVYKHAISITSILINFNHPCFNLINICIQQYHGGTNFGRTASAYIITSYYDQAPLDEYGTDEIITFRDRLINPTKPFFLFFSFFVSYIFIFNYLKYITGLTRQPKWGHLKELHAAINSCSETLLQGNPSNFSLGQLQEVSYAYQSNSFIIITIAIIILVIRY